MLQLGMAIGKSILGEEAIENMKKGDLSKLMEAGEKVLGEDAIKSFLDTLTETEGAFPMKEGEKDEVKTSENEDILEDDEELVDTEGVKDIGTEDQTIEKLPEEDSSLSDTEASTEKRTDEL